MGGDVIKPEGTDRQMAAFTKNLPNYLRSIGGSVGPFDQSLVNARATVDPQEMALDESLLKYFGPRFNEIGSQLQGQNAMNQASNEYNVLTGPGADLAMAGQQLNKAIDPEYYNLRSLAANKFTDLLNSQDPNRLTGSEMANVERGLNRTNSRNGVADNRSSTGSIQNAMTFGAGLDKKRGLLLDSLKAIPTNLASMKSGTDAFQVATGRSSQPNQGMNQFQTGRQGFGANVSGMAGGLLGEAGQNVRQNNDLTANARDSLDRVTQVMGSLPSC